MKEFLTKIKLGLVALWVQLISFSSKALGDIIETFWDARQNEPKYEPMQAAYWVPNPTNHINPILNAALSKTQVDWDAGDLHIVIAYGIAEAAHRDPVKCESVSKYAWTIFIFFMYLVSCKFFFTKIEQPIIHW